MRVGAVSSFVGVLVVSAVLAAAAAAQSPDPGGATAPSNQGQARSGATPGAGGQDGRWSGGSGYGSPAIAQLTVPGTTAKIMSDGFAAAPAAAPIQVQRAIWAANAIIGDPYIYGGGHMAFKASGYDCSGTVSFALHGGRMLRSPLDSRQFERWGIGGSGLWISVFANPGHAYMDIAGIRLDTSSADDPSGGKGPRWRPLRHSNSGYLVRHPLAM